MAVSDYAGRNIDVLALRAQPGDAEAALEQTLFGNNPGEVCTGIIKLSQRWVLEFLTLAGSMPFLPKRGTDFVRAVQFSWLHTEADVQTQFNFGAALVRQNLLTEETENTPDDERLKTATLTRIGITPAALILTVSLLSRAGELRDVLLPVTVAPVAPDL